MADVDKLAQLMDDYAFGTGEEQAKAVAKVNDYIEAERRDARIELARPIVEAVENVGKNHQWHFFVVNWLRARWPLLFSQIVKLQKRYHEDLNERHYEQD